MEHKLIFNITSIAWDKAVEQLIHHHEPIRLVLNKLNIKDYGIALNYMCMIYVAQAPTSTMHKNYILYRKKTKGLVWQYLLDYNTIINNTDYQNRQILAYAYIEALEEIEDQNKVPDFDFAAFRRDVTHLFETEGWLLKEAA